MRSEVQPHDDIRAHFEAVSAGAGVTGLSPTVQIQRVSDSQWWDDGTSDWVGAAPTAATMVAVDATNFPGLYEYAIPPGDLDHDLGLEGYIMRIEDASEAALEHVLVVPRRQSALDETWADYTGDTSKLGHLLAVALNMSGQYFFKFNAATVDYDVDGRLTQYSVSVYPTSNDAILDQNAIESNTYQLTYDGNGNLTDIVKV